MPNALSGSTGQEVACVSTRKGWSTARQASDPDVEN